MFLCNHLNFTKINKVNIRLLSYLRIDAFPNRAFRDYTRVCFYNTTYNKRRVGRGLSHYEANSSKVRKYGRLTGAKKEDHAKSLVRTFWRVWGTNSSKLTYYYDQVSLARVIDSFHFDLPKTIPNIKDYILTFLTKPQYQYLKEKIEFNSNQNVKNKPKDKSKVIQFQKIYSPMPLKESSQVSSTREKEDHLGTDSLNNPKEITSSAPTEDDSASKRGEGVLTSASEAVVATFKNFSNYLPRSIGTTPSQVKVSRGTRVTTLVDASTGQTKVRVSWMESRQEAVERGIRGLLDQLSEDQERLMEVCRYLANFPTSSLVAAKEPGLVCRLLEARRKGGYEVLQATNKALHILGHSDPLRSKGIRLLSLDGGGTRGLITLNVLKELERMSGRPIYELFDYVCGVSTGSLIGVMACVLKLPLHQAESVYRHFSKKMFDRNKLIGASRLVIAHAYYDTTLWEDILRRNLGAGSLVDSMSDCSHISVVSTLMNHPRVQNFLFRNYNLPPLKRSRYQGSVEHRLWEAVRASSAAPGYFEEFQLDGHVHQDGGVLTNNPTAIAIHEARLIWPKEPIQCVVSIGTGWYEATSGGRQEIVKSSLRSKITKMIESATDTEGIHMVLKDFLPAPKYFRFNPGLSGSFELDETRDTLWKQMERDAALYCKKNRKQLEAAAGQLVRSKSRWELARGWMSDRIKPPLQPFK